MGWSPKHVGPTGAAPVFALALALGCGDDDRADPGGAGGAGGGGCDDDCKGCPEGFAPRAAGIGCEAIVPADPCPAGTMPSLGDEACVPVGSPACPAGFVLDETGYGCADVVPASPCAGATRDVLGSATCQPIGDCGAPFPPVDATLFVDDDFGPAEIDATHFDNIGAAITAAPPGATIAIEAGTYVEAIDATKPVTLIGRCPAQVIVSTPGGDLPGLRAVGVSEVAARGMTFVGHVVGVGVIGGSIEIDACVIEGASSVGALAGGAGTTLTVRTSVVRRTVPNAAGDPPWGIGAQQGASVLIEDTSVSENDFANVVALREGASVVVRRSVLRNGRPPAVGSSAMKFGLGVYAYEGGSATVEESAIIDNESAGALSASTASATGAPSSLELIRSTVRGTRREIDAEAGRGVSADNGATVRLEDAWVYDNQAGNVVAVDGAVEISGGTLSGAVATQLAELPNLIAVGSSVVTATGTALIRGREVGVATQLGAEVTLERCLIAFSQPGPAAEGSPGGAGALGLGLSVASGSRVTLVGSTLLENQAVAAIASGEGSALTMTNTLVLNTLPAAGGAFGRGVEITKGASLAGVRVAIGGHQEVGLLVGLGGAATLEESAIGAITASSAGFGHGALSLEASSLSLVGTTVWGAEGIGVGVAGASAFVGDSVITGCAVGVHVQDGTSLVEADTPSTDKDLTISSDSQIVDNGARVGTGAVPLPTPLGAP
jgi:hypothetical protein